MGCHRSVRELECDLSLKDECGMTVEARLYLLRLNVQGHQK